MKFVTWLSLIWVLVTPTARAQQEMLGYWYWQYFPQGSESAQFKPAEVVVKIAKHHFDGKQSLKHAGFVAVSDSGTGYCFGRGKCDFILTNYHVAQRVGSPLKVNGVNVLQTFEATSPQDKSAVWERSPLGFSIKLVPIRDIAILRLDHPLKGMHGIPLSSQELYQGENVRVYGYPGGKKLTMVSAAFYGETTDGILIFKARPEDEKALIPGLSGSLVVNEENEAVGLVKSVGNAFIEAVPVWSITDFVKKVQPQKYPEILSSPGADDILLPHHSRLELVDLEEESESRAEDIEPEVGMSPPPALPEQYLWYGLDTPTPPIAPEVGGAHVRVEEPPYVRALRKRAEDMIERINDLIAIGTQRSMGGRTPEVTTQYKLRMLSGHQTFTMDGKEALELPCPKGNGIGLSSAWADSPTMLGNNLKLRIQQVDDLALEGWGTVKVFRYEGAAEDKVAKIDYCTYYGFHIHTEKVVSVPVRGEVWTDDALNILRITQELLAPPSMHWVNLRESVLYGWLESPKGERELVPTNIISRAELTDDHQVYSTFCRITDYYRFTVSVVVGDQRSVKLEPESSRRNRDAGQLPSRADHSN